MPKSEFAKAVDQIQIALRLRLAGRGFRARGRTFNRTTEDGLTQVVNIQMGASDPPGTTYIPGFRENAHGTFTVNLGVFVPEVARHRLAGRTSSWVQEYDCCVRSRLGEACGERRDRWWPASADDAVIEDVTQRLVAHGLPFLERFATRERLLAELDGRSIHPAVDVPRIVTALILVERGDREHARRLLGEQARGTDHLGHAEYVRELAAKLGLGALDA